jgi:lysozyme
MTQLEQHRAKAVQLLLQKADKVIPMLVDYQLDDFLRGLLNLPGRPEGHPPYSGWMVSQKLPLEAPRYISDTGLALIKRWEGCRISAYQCPAKVWTIGYGHTKTCKPGMKITLAEAERLLRQDLAEFEQAVSKLVKVPLSQHQFDALVSFAFNVGSGALAKSTLLSLLNRKNYLAAAEEFKRWTKAGNVTLRGLVDRRQEEYELFMS